MITGVDAMKARAKGIAGELEAELTAVLDVFSADRGDRRGGARISYPVSGNSMSRRSVARCSRFWMGERVLVLWVLCRRFQPV